VTTREPSAEPLRQLDASTELAVIRTQLALDRTLMAWVRTSISLITFGYAVYRVVEAVPPNAAAHHGLISHRMFGLTMIVMGLVSLILGAQEHSRSARLLRADYPGARGSTSHVRVLTGLVALLGTMAALTMIFRE
jgi:putative membrane protein